MIPNALIFYSLTTVRDLLVSNRLTAVKHDLLMLTAVLFYLKRPNREHLNGAADNTVAATT